MDLVYIGRDAGVDFRSVRAVIVFILVYYVSL